MSVIKVDGKDKTLSTPDKNILNPRQRMRELTHQFSQVQLERGLRVDMYLKSGRTMINMIRQHISNGEIESAYKLATRFVTIFVELLPRTAEYERTLNSQQKEEWKNRTYHILEQAEKMKSQLLIQFEKEANEWQRRIDDHEKTLGAQIANVTQIITQPQPSCPLANDDAKPPTPFVDRSNKPIHTVAKTNSSPWRAMNIPSSLISSFVRLAEPNTVKNIETCGILCGHILADCLTLTHLILPKQSGSSDSCTTSNEEEIFDYLDNEGGGLITLGWIHTHPSQTAFLSSVDLHTHLSYQLMLPEAVAIVCAPKFGETGYFWLTPSYGLNYILQCQKTGFHPHPSEPPLFENAPYIELSDKLKITIIDLRR